MLQPDSLRLVDRAPPAEAVLDFIRWVDAVVEDVVRRDHRRRHRRTWAAWRWQRGEHHGWALQGDVGFVARACSRFKQTEGPAWLRRRDNLLRQRLRLRQRIRAQLRSDAASGRLAPDAVAALHEVLSWFEERPPRGAVRGAGA